MARRPERAVTRPGEPARMPAAGRLCGRDAGPDWCTDPVFSRGLCRRHYRRAAKGLPLDPDNGHQVGITASGHGTWGIIDTRTDGRLRCHDCNRWYIALSIHIAAIHGTVRDYRLRHGLTMSTPLVAETHSATLRAAIDDTALTRIADARRPETLTADPDIIYRGQRLHRAHRQ